jgi:hypothetical protein
MGLVQGGRGRLFLLRVHFYLPFVVRDGVNWWGYCFRLYEGVQFIGY